MQTCCPPQLQLTVRRSGRRWPEVESCFDSKHFARRPTYAGRHSARCVTGARSNQLSDSLTGNNFKQTTDVDPRSTSTAGHIQVLRLERMNTWTEEATRTLFESSHQSKEICGQSNVLHGFNPLPLACHIVSAKNIIMKASMHLTPTRTLHDSRPRQPLQICP